MNIYLQETETANDIDLLLASARDKIKMFAEAAPEFMHEAMQLSAMRIEPANWIALFFQKTEIQRGEGPWPRKR